MTDLPGGCAAPPGGCAAPPGGCAAPPGGRAAPIPFYRASLDEEEIAAAARAIRSGWLTTAGEARAFEAEFRAWVGGRTCVATNSGTAALHLALVLHGIGRGDEVVVPSVTFAATANVVAHLGATIVFADVEPDTGLLSAEGVAAAASHRTRAIIPVHLHGVPCDPGPLVEAAETAGAERERLLVLEDAAHAFPAALVSDDGERPAGTLGRAAAFSFYATKNITTGEGGMLVLSDASLEGRARSLLLHGMSADAWRRYHGTGSRYRVVEAGYKYNLPDPLAAIGRVQLGKIGLLQARREALWRRYEAGLAGLDGVGLPITPDGVRHARHLFALRVRPGEPAEARAKARDALGAALAEAGVATSVHFPALHLEEAYEKLRKAGRARWNDLPNAESFAAGTLSLPFYPDLSEESADRVIEAVRRGLAGA